uniref:Pancreatic trypsin inhibitor n=1 Tax=Rhipicephalus zambeziensis TaxID=60191 RepID=A0A224Y9W2_9ACAR
MKLLLWITAVCSVFCLIHTHGGCMGKCSPRKHSSQDKKAWVKWMSSVNTSSTCRRLKRAGCTVKKALFRSCERCVRACLAPPADFTPQQYGMMCAMGMGVRG